MKIRCASLLAGTALASTTLAGGLLDRPLSWDPLDQPQDSETSTPTSQSREASQKKGGPVSRDTLIRLRASGWFTGMDGKVRSGDSFPGVQSDIDFQDTLNLSKNKAVVDATIGLNLGSEHRWKIDAGFTGPFHYTGSSGAVSVSFDNVIYTGQVDSRVRFNIYQINIMRDWVRQGPFTFSLGTGTRIFDFDATLTGTGSDSVGGAVSTRTQSVSKVVPIPGLAAGMRFDLTDRLYVSGSGQGIYLGNYGQFFDAKGEVGFDLTRNIGVFAGYRWINAKADVSDVFFRTNIRGLYTGLEIRF
jgi:hypothetical protein